MNQAEDPAQHRSPQSPDDPATPVISLCRSEYVALAISNRKLVRADSQGHRRLVDPSTGQQFVVDHQELTPPIRLARFADRLRW